jgi:cohesin loading factor subunit SCC2
MALLEDIFEAEDNLASDVEIKDLPTDFFSPLTVDCAQPLLNPNILHKLSKYIAQATRPSKRFRVFSHDGPSGTGSTPRQTGRMADINHTILSRILKILDRSVRACEGVEPFRNSNTNVEGSMSPRKLSKKKGAKKNAQNPDDAGDAVDNASAIEEPLPSQELDQSDFDKLSWTLDVARESTLAANCCIALLGSDRLTKQVSA